MRVLAADHVLPVSRPPIVGGAIAIDGTTIVSVGTIDEITERFPNERIEHLGRAALLPGFVNAHSHLEITAMRGALDDVESDFLPWLLKLNDIRKGLSDDEIRSAAVGGAREGARAGVTCFGDIGRFGSIGLDALKSVGLRGVVYQETEFSPDDRTADDDFEKLIAKFEELTRGATDLVTVGLSPHSPYTVGPRLLGMIAAFARENGVKLSIHAAESAAESELLQYDGGIFRGLFDRGGTEWQSPDCSTIEYFERLGVLSAAPLLAHCVTVSDADIDLIAASGSSIAHCPKSNAKLGHKRAPLEKFLASGIATGLGSDSVASNNVCDMLEEARFAVLAARIGSGRFLTAREILETSTLGGANVLGLGTVIGSLEPGKFADITAVRLGHPAQEPLNDVESALVFSSNARDVMLTIVNGIDVYRT